MKIGRNNPCHCGSGKKYKKCCLRKDEGFTQNEQGLWQAPKTITVTKEMLDKILGPAESPVQPEKTVSIPTAMMDAQEASIVSG